MTGEDDPIHQLRAYLTDADAVSSLSESFSIFAFDAFEDLLTDVDMRLLLWRGALDEPLNGLDAEHLLRSRLDQHRVAQRCLSWAEQHLDVRELRRRTRETWVHVDGPAPYALTGAGFDSESLGVIAAESLQLLQEHVGDQAVAPIAKQMAQLWGDHTLAAPVGDQFLARLRELVRDNDPESVYLRVITALFEDFLAESADDTRRRGMTGFYETQVWKKLYKFQRDGVLGAIQKLERHNGCIIADSVGLGKTFEALAVIKYYEFRNDRVLVLAPKRLRENWTIYRSNDVRNPLVDDRFNYDVLNHTDLSRDIGFSGDIDLSHINWGNYDLVVIDESHNFRNNPQLRRDTKTRYQKLMEDVFRAGVKTKVLMLSATPVNTRLADLKNQVLFATEGNDDALVGDGIKSIASTLRQAQTRFRAWQATPEAQRSAQSLVSHLGLDYIRLLDLVTIARSRKHIEKYYGTSDVGRFPDRRKPVNIKSAIDARDELMPLADLNRKILGLNLASYKPMSYVLPSHRDRYAHLYDHRIAGSGERIFRQEHRDNNVVHLLRVNLLKRLESSVNSMAMTVGKMLHTVQTTIDKLDAYDADHSRAISLAEIEGRDWDDLNFDDPMFEDAVVGSNVKVLLPDIDRPRWRQELEEDRDALRELLDEMSVVTPARDLKLAKLKDNLREKIENPYNTGNRKALVFTAFSDTAEYLYEHIAPWAQKEFGIHVALVTGSTAKATLKMPRTDMLGVLTAFSPLSKSGDPAADQIDLVIATDAISEGQNLQDCDTVVNYDIHWNPVRIVQRFGRVDRLGTQNTSVQLVNFWPDLDLESYINLEKRVSGRMALLDVSATGEENLLTEAEQKAMNDLEYRRKQLEQMQTAAPTMEDLAGGLSITDLTLSDFRMDAAARDANALAELAQWPQALHGVARFDATLDAEGLGPGAVFLLRVRDEEIPLPPAYPLAPFLLLYVTDDGMVAHAVDEPKLALDVLRRHGMDAPSVDAEAVASFARRTRGGARMHHYRGLLEAAITAATGKGTENRVASLFTAGPSLLGRGGASAGRASVDLIAWMALVP
ncbi:helicase-related protein [Cellulomonas endometrii]|uniref:helicase-related protein n=1 Tax=Cellulomonas endometrii TaxID=3036301 RepID=UPI0024ACAEE2|nr:helicase-related protein [Cellulomonas endometrii]